MSSDSSRLPYLFDLTEDKIDKLFQELDVNKDGTIDIKDLTAALNRSRIPQAHTHAENLIKQYDVNKSGDITYKEFVDFVKEREKNLKITFARFDKDRDGHILIEEVRATFHDLGLELSKEDCSDILRKLEKSKTYSISWNEWREFFLLHPVTSEFGDLLRYWNHSLIDVGEAGIIPEDDANIYNTSLLLRNLAAGGVAGAVSRTCTAPMDRLRIFLQVYGAHHQYGIASAFAKLWREGGIAGMFRGNFVNVLKIAPETAVKFACFEKLKKVIHGDSDKPIGPVQRLIAGSTAGAIAQTSIYPMEVIKTRLALGRTGEYRSMVDCAFGIARNEGLRSFYRGYLPSVIGIVPYAGIDLAVYETLRSLYLKDGQEPEILVTLTCGVVSSTCGQLASFPLNVLRTNMQAKSNLGEGRNTMSGLFFSILREDGFTGLYRGLVPSMMKTAPAISITYVVYEKLLTAPWI